MAIYYAASTGGFYDTKISRKKPKDTVQITDAYRVELLEGQADGKIIWPDENGYPVLIDKEPMTAEEENGILKRQAAALLNECNAEALGYLETGTTMPAELAEYRAALRAAIEYQGTDLITLPNR
jgi:hypothetical protein